MTPMMNLISDRSIIQGLIKTLTAKASLYAVISDISAFIKDEGPSTGRLLIDPNWF